MILTEMDCYVVFCSKNELQESTQFLQNITVAKEKSEKTIPKQCLFISPNTRIHFIVTLCIKAAMRDLSHRKPATTWKLEPVSLYSSIYLT